MNTRSEKIGARNKEACARNTALEAKLKELEVIKKTKDEKTKELDNSELGLRYLIKILEDACREKEKLDNQLGLAQKTHEEELCRLSALRAKEVEKYEKGAHKVVAAKYKLCIDLITQASTDSEGVQQNVLLMSQTVARTNLEEGDYSNRQLTFVPGLVSSHDGEVRGGFGEVGTFGQPSENRAEDPLADMEMPDATIHGSNRNLHESSILDHPVLKLIYHTRIARKRYMPSSTRSNKETHLLFSEDPAHLECSIRKDQCSTSLDAAVFMSTDSRTQPSTDTRPSSSTDPHRSTSIDTTPLTSIDPQSRNMVAIVILDKMRMETCMTSMVICVMQQVVKHAKLGEGDFEVESSMSFDGSQCAVRIMTHEEFAEKHPHPPSPFYVKIDRPHEPAIDRQRETDIDRPPSPPIDRRAPLTYRVRLPSIDRNRIKALRPPPKPLANPP
ncbi:hypothetical protein F2Q70_00036260 [Brassica cretica]|uniref:Uncharacterized protein n=1 Tax=Brassica cretica TaxID=69181 RepID=A0A8S9JY40_BRACR|nr:hypothetical protein F2Q70_00036260 [Brassica cretica]